MSWWLAIALQSTSIVPDANAFDLANASKPTTLTVVPRCPDMASSDEIVVCGKRRDQYRLPLPRERTVSTERPRGEAQTGMAALTPPGRCGIFAGERRCNKREAAEYGYGKGRDPITILARLAEKISDPDAN